MLLYPQTLPRGTACAWCAQKVHTILLFSTSAHRLRQSSGLLPVQKRHCQSAVLAARGLGLRRQRRAASGTITHGTQCPGLDADPHLPAASWHGFCVSGGASAPGSGTPACASWVEPCVIVRLIFSEVGLRLAAGGGTGYGYLHGLLTCNPFTGRIWVELLPVVLASSHG